LEWYTDGLIEAVEFLNWNVGLLVVIFSVACVLEALLWPQREKPKKKGRTARTSQRLGTFPVSHFVFDIFETD
jgi:hypothetical protein